MGEQWGSRSGLILAAIGAAAGLGNIWRFAYLAGENGGAFLLVNLLIALALGVPLVVAELTIGKRSARSPSEKEKQWPVSATAFRETVDPKPTVRVQHHLDDGAVLKPSRDARAEGRAAFARHALSCRP
jgi:hypothetical protein